MSETYEMLKLESQLCFPLYACSKEVVKKYKPFLDKIGLTYTQYIAMLALWEVPCMTVKEMGKRLYLDSGTLTPLLKKLEQKGYVKRCRDKQDERVVNITITKQGEALKKEAVDIPKQMSCCIQLEESERKELYRILHKLLNCL